MKSFIKLYCIGIFMLVCFNITLSQENKTFNVKVFQDSDQRFGSFNIIKSYNSVSADVAYQTFEIQVNETGEYFLNAWALGAFTKDGLLQYEVYIDDSKSPVGKLNMKKANWQAAGLEPGKSIYLTSGNHTISFRCPVPNIPMVEFIRIAKTGQDAHISSKEYDDYVEMLKAEIAPKVEKSSTTDSTALSLHKELDNPLGNYEHRIDQKFGYSYYRYFYFYVGQPVTFETKRSDPYASDPVMQLFNYSDPLNKGSWTDDDGGVGPQSKISVTVQYTGNYILFIRNYRAGQAGTSDLYLYDNLYASDVPFNNYYGIRCDHSLTDELNYFTANTESGGDTRIWIEDRTGFPGLFVAYNDDYWGSGDFSWGLHSRVKKAFNRSIRSGHVTAYSSSAPIKYCDFYLNCRNSTIMSYFPNLEDDDAIMAANTNNGVYNCISWSGGITTDWIWPPQNHPGNLWYVFGDPLASFDRFYGNNPRRPIDGMKAWTYTRSGATSSNNCIDIWSYSGTYTHASVNSKYRIHSNDLPANGNPHGYDWESKPGGLMRTFHPRSALNESSYGDINKYYRWDGTYAPGEDLAKTTGNGMIFDESIAAGLTKIEIIELTEPEKAKMDNLIAKLPEKLTQNFNTKYLSWKETWDDPNVAIHSDPRKYAASIEYNAFLEFCKNQGKGIWPLLFQKYFDGDIHVQMAILDLSESEFRSLINEIRENSRNRYTKEGVYIAPTFKSGMMKYIKELLSFSDNSWNINKDSDSVDDGQSSLSVPQKFSLKQNYPNPFNPETVIQFGLPADALVSLKIYNVNGQEVITLLNNESRNKGWHKITWKSNDSYGNKVASGVYFIKLLSGPKITTKKMIITR